MDISWEDVRLFVAVSDAGSLSGAARHLGIGQPTVTRRLALLEEAVGFVLFERSVEGAVLTSAGEKLLEPALRMAEWAAELERGVEGGASAPRGIVRLTAPPGVAFDFVAPFAAGLRERLPDVQLQVLSSIRYVDLVRREADLALRIQPVTQRDLVNVASVDIRTRAVATPGYRATLPRKYGVADVDWIAWAPPFTHLAPTPQLEALIPDFRPVFASDDFLVQLRAAEAGVGAMVLGDMNHRWSRSALEPLDLEFGSDSQSALHLVCARSALDIPRVRAVADALIEELESYRASER